MPGREVSPQTQEGHAPSPSVKSSFSCFNLQLLSEVMSAFSAMVSASLTEKGAHSMGAAEPRSEERPWRSVATGEKHGSHRRCRPGADLRGTGDMTTSGGATSHREASAVSLSHSSPQPRETPVCSLIRMPRCTRKSYLCRFPSLLPALRFHRQCPTFLPRWFLGVFWQHVCTHLLRSSLHTPATRRPCSPDSRAKARVGSKASLTSWMPWASMPRGPGGEKGLTVSVPAFPWWGNGGSFLPES